MRRRSPAGSRGYKVPKYVFFVKDYPMTASGKIQKYKLRELGVKLLKEAGVEIT